MTRETGIKKWMVLALAALLPVVSACASSKSRLKMGEAVDGEVVEAEGLAAVTNDLIGVKRAALSDAYKNAVEKVVGIFISARTQVDKAVTIEHKILGKTDGYVKKHDVLKEGVEADGLYHTHIRALVSYQQIQQDLKDLEVIDAPLLGNPRVAILLDETVEGTEGQTTACSDALAQALIDKGYKVVDRSELASIRVAEATQQLLSGNPDKALKPILQKLGAEVVITGKATAQQLNMQNLGGLFSYRGNISAKALKSQTSEILAVVTMQASGLDATKETASQKALAQTGAGAGGEFGAKVAKELARRTSLFVTVDGIKDLNQLGDIKDAVSKTSGVSDLTLRSYSEGRAEIDVKTGTTPPDIAAALTRSAKLKGIALVHQTSETLEFKLP